MKIKANKFYLTREGLTAYVAAVKSPFPDTYSNCEAIGWVDDPEIAKTNTAWSIDGKSCVSSFGEKTIYDLVSYAPKEMKKLP